MTNFYFPKLKFRRQDVLAKRRQLEFPKAWKFAHNRSHFILQFDNLLFKRFYSQKRLKVSLSSPNGIIKVGEGVLRHIRGC